MYDTIQNRFSLLILTELIRFSKQGQHSSNLLGGFSAGSSLASRVRTSPIRSRSGPLWRTRASVACDDSSPEGFVYSPAAGLGRRSDACGRRSHSSRRSRYSILRMDRILSDGKEVRERRLDLEKAIKLFTPKKSRFLTKTGIVLWRIVGRL